MIITSTFLSIILILIGAITICISFWAFNKRKLHGALEFALFMLSVSIYTFGYALEISHTDLPGILAAIKFEYTAIPYMGHFSALFSYKYASGKSLNKYLIGIMLIIPVLSTILVYTVEYHSLFYINPKVIDGKFFPVFSFDKGPIYLLRIFYQQFISLISIIYLFTKFLKSDRLKKAQLLALITAQLIPGILLIFYMNGLIPGGIDINPFSAFIVGTIFSIAILRFRLFEIIPHGREVALESIGEAFILIDKAGIVQDFNSAAKKLDFIDLKYGYILPLGNFFTKKINTAIKHNVTSFEYTYKSKYNFLSYYQINISNLNSSFNRIQGKTIIVNDITDVMSLMEKLEHRATYDYLTNLRNRGYIIESGIREIEISNRNSTPLSFIMVDIDNFKIINDTYGHKIGDKVLIEVANRLKSSLRNIDIIGRYGGEEFLIICPNTTKEDGISTAERLRKSIFDEVISVVNIKTDISCSFGVHTYSENIVTNIDKLIEKADRALYESKNSGRNRVCFKT